MKHRYPGTGCKEIVPNRDLRYPSTRHGDDGEIQAASVRHVLGPDARGEDIRAAAFARWLAGEVGEGALAPTTRRSASRESREELREAWRVLCAALPKAWIVKTPVDCQQAIVELATDGVIGEGLFPVPIGRRPGEPTPAPEFDQERLDGALSTLGRRLETGGESERLRHSRLLLSETLLSIRPHCPMDDHLFALPLLRAIGLPEDREEAWSITELHCQIENRRVFASPASEAQDYDGADGTQPERSSDPKRATTELAIALDETVWLVNGDAVASVADDVPSPAPETLASAVLRAGAFAEPVDRALLLHRLAPNISDGADLCLAARMLLAGRAADVVGWDTELFHARAGSEDALLILLRLLDRSWCAVDRTLVESLSQDVLEVLSVSQVDLEVLHRLLDDCLDKLVDWTALSDGQAVDLLRYLYSVDPEAERRWRRIPLHRGVDGSRGAFNDRARRSTERAAEFPLPQELCADVRLLNPEPELARLYDSVPEIDRDGILQLMLENSRPWRFAERIVQAVRSDDGQVSLPRAPDLRELLRHSCWLPDRGGEGFAPDAVLVAPEEVLNAVSDLAASHAFGDKRLPDAIDPAMRQAALSVVREILGRPNRMCQIQRIVDSLDSELIGQVDAGAWLVMPHPSCADSFSIEDGLQSILTSTHPGWKLVHVAACIIGNAEGHSHDNLNLPINVAKALSAPIPSYRQIEILRCLADTRPAKGSAAGFLFRRYLGWFVETDDFFAHVLPELDLPTQDGNWHASREVAVSETGIARRHRLIPELRSILRLKSDDPVSVAQSVGSTLGENGLDALEKYFEPWRDKVPHGAVGAFLSLLGNGLCDVIANLADKWLGEDVAIAPIEGFDRNAVSVFVSPKVAYGDRVSAVNAIGSRVEMAAEADEDTLFAVDPCPYPPLPPASALAPLGAFWQIDLRDVEPRDRSPSELLRLLGGTVERWATTCLKLDRTQVQKWWAQWGKGSQADFAPVLASIKAHLPLTLQQLKLDRTQVQKWWAQWGKGSQADFAPVLASIKAHLPRLTLQQLDVKENEPLWDALREADRAQRKREQAPSEETLHHEREALSCLATLIREPRHRDFLWNRVNEIMRRYGYEEESTLLELAQNADDALSEAAEIEAGPLSQGARRLLIRVHDHDDAPTVDVMHWGRPINDTGGAAFPAGRERQWDQDLYFMMLMNLSGKPGESLGKPSSSSTTGRFGLGFKSVHLVSQSPSVVSRFISFYCRRNVAAGTSCPG